MKLTLQNTVLRFDLLTLLFPCAAILLGERRVAAALALAVAAHELAHLAAARAVHAVIASIRITPFGGMMQIDNLYAVPAPRLVAIAVAGPAANLLMMLVGSALYHASLLSPLIALEWIQTNAALMLFNLLPALPLDGGRLLWALLSLRLSRVRALKIAVFSGRVLAGILVALTAWGFAVRGQCNLSLLFAAVFILVSSKDDQEAMANSRALTLLHGLRPIAKPTPADLIAIDASTPPRDALFAARPDRVALFAVYQSGRLSQIIDEQALLDRLNLSEKN